MIDDLYSAQLLKLAANLPRSGRLAAPQASVEKVAKLCGSRVRVDVAVQDGRVTDFAQEVKACALGQAAASVLGAHVIGDVELGAHSSVWFQCVIRADVNRIRIGHHTNIQDGTVIHVNRTDPVEIGDHVTLGHAVRLHGARVGSHCLIAIGAIVLDGVVMEDESIVAAGALVSPGTRIPPRTLMMGSPAKPRRTLTDADLELIHRPTNNYVKLMELYRDGG